MEENKKTLTELAIENYNICRDNGWTDNHEVGTDLMLMTSELAEALEGDRNNRHANWNQFEIATETGVSQKDAFEAYIKDTIEDELADCMLRIMDFSIRKGIDIEKHIKMKMQYNKTRGYHHGGKKY